MSEPARHSGLETYGHRGRAGRGGRTARAARRLGALAAGCAILLGAAPQAGALGAPGAASRPGLMTEVSGEYPVVVTIDGVSPAVATPNGTVTITGQVTNGGRAPLKSPHAAVRAPFNHKPLNTRSDLASVATRNDPAGVDGVDLPSPQAALNELGPGQSQPFTLQVAVADLELDREGAYELAVDVRGSTGDNQRERPLGIARTFLPYNPNPTDAQPTQVATLWPITHTPELVAQTLSDNDQSVAVLRDDSLAAEFAPGGRLYELVDIGAGLNAPTWVVDPDLLDTAYAMTKPYRVQKPNTAGQSAKDENTTQGTGTAAAAAWLDKLRAAVAKKGGEVVSLPYADPDIASIAHNGADLSGVDTALLKAGTAGQVTAEGRLSVDVRGDVAWPYQGYLDQQIAATAQRGGDNLLLVNGASLPEADSLKYTPGAVRPLGNGQTGVVADNTVSGLFQNDLNTPQAQSEAVQRFLAETFVITRQEPHNQRGLLVMPPRGLTVNTAKTLASALQSANAGQWTTPVTLDTVAQAAADPRANGAVPPATDYPGEARASELSAKALTETMAIQSKLDLLMRILTLPQRVRGPFSAAMVRSVSTEWRTQGPAGDTYRDGVRDYLAELSQAVRVPKKGVITFAGDTGVLQVSVRNDLTQSVTNLKLVLTSSQPNRLKVGDPADIVLGASRSVTMQFPAEAHNNGQATMTAQLWTTGPDPQRYGDPVTFNVMVTSVTDGVLYVIGAGLLLILLAALRIYRQRKKQGADPDADGDRPLDEAADGGGPDRAEGPRAAPEDDDEGPDDDRDAVQTLRGTTADGRDRATGDEKVGP
ncbi:DUF6049 family protein [Kitasatospora herbaricolor]|uniref:DUF6049 family protein n=1 Tax=Kitasatospora herbaricolor TaxID=68217 RepID=A0ABZ1WAA1_9ACTN|nr:DUF6049 family protein [Kitasatospora herbaricolor]